MKCRIFLVSGSVLHHRDSPPHNVLVVSSRDCSFHHQGVIPLVCSAYSLVPKQFPTVEPIAYRAVTFLLLFWIKLTRNNHGERGFKYVSVAIKQNIMKVLANKQDKVNNKQAFPNWHSQRDKTNSQLKMNKNILRICKETCIIKRKCLRNYFNTFHMHTIRLIISHKFYHRQYPTMNPCNTSNKL